MNKLFIFIVLISVLFVPNSFAQKNSIKLLAVNEATGNGTIVDLELNVVDGSGKVFVETQPLSQIDTQISLRIGKTIACKTTEAYCLNKDFFYSMKTSSPVVAGPSAGAAITLLTIASLENKMLNPDFVITGTINSGGVIGVVGGVKEKIKAAVDAKMKVVLMPKDEENSTDLIDYGKEMNITVIEVSDTEEAYEIFTGEKKIKGELKTNQRYNEIMKTLNEETCERASSLNNELNNYNLTDNLLRIKERGTNLSLQAENLTKRGLYYSSASRCFGTNVFFREALLKAKNLTAFDIQKEIGKIDVILRNLEIELNYTKINNIGDLETAMIIKERIYDARKNLESANETNSTRELSYALERTYSASAWKRFYGFSKNEIDKSKLRQSCILKIEEVQEIYNYVSIYLPTLLEETKKEFDKTKEYLDSEDYILCLFKASKSEAEINSALSTLYIKDENVKSLVQNKILAAKKAIIKQEEKGNFPILGYSYYEYATVLNETEKYTALLYAEYGIELSNLDIYFAKPAPLEIRINGKALLTLIIGVVIGIAIALLKKQYKRKRISFRR